MKKARFTDSQIMSMNRPVFCRHFLASFGLVYPSGHIISSHLKHLLTMPADVLFCRP